VSARLELRELPGELVVRVTEPRSIRTTLLNVSGGALIILFFFHALSGPTLILAGVAVAAILGMQIILTFRGANVELRVTNLDFVSTGHSPSDYHPSIIPRAETHHLEFRDANNGGAEVDLPQGLYVEHNGPEPWSLATCVLPHANRVQTDGVIEEIFRMFPDTGTLPQTGDDKPYLTLLNLSRPTTKVDKNPFV
jgi:hypothetical protein